MIYEFRTYTLQRGKLQEFYKRWAEKLPKRLELSPLTACWHTEIGPLNQVVHVWEYKDVNERSRIRAEAQRMGVWPPNTLEFITDMQSDILHPLPFSPRIEPSSHGPFFEMRTYTLKAGTAPQMMAGWEEKLAGRLALSPLIGVFMSDIGALNKWVHIWAYKSLDERMAVRKKAIETGVWPPPRPTPMERQETKILLPAPFSPIK
ncbi:MAG: NIPSNAP family protein [Hyphomicrobiaceae bacterium]